MKVLNSIQSAGHEESTREGTIYLDEDTEFGVHSEAVYSLLVGPSPGENPCDLDENDAISAVGVPSLGDSLSWDQNGCFVTRLAAKEISSVSGLYRVTVTFDTQPNSESAFFTYHWDTEHIEKLIEVDPVTGSPITNSVGEPLKLTAPRSIPVLTVDKVVSSPVQNLILNYVDRVNSTPFWGFPPYTVLLSGIRDQPINIRGFPRRKVTYMFKIDLTRAADNVTILGWRVELLNHATKYRNVGQSPYTIATQAGRALGPGVGEYVPFSLLQKQTATGNIDMTGAPLPPYDPNNPASHVVWIRFNRFPIIDFTPLGIVPPF